MSVETTRWAGVVDPRADERAWLDAPCREAAIRYVDRIRSMSLGLLGPGDQDRLEVGPSIYIRPLGVKVVEVMSFGPLRQEHPGSYYFEVEGGLLRSKHQEGAPGRLTFEWWREGADELFRTTVRGYRSALVGKKANAAQRAFYSTTQMNAHRWVMWRFHVWARKERDALVALLDS